MNMKTVTEATVNLKLELPKNCLECPFYAKKSDGLVAGEFECVIAPFAYSKEEFHKFFEGDVIYSVKSRPAYCPLILKLNCDDVYKSSKEDCEIYECEGYQKSVTDNEPLEQCVKCPMHKFYKGGAFSTEEMLEFIAAVKMPPKFLPGRRKEIQENISEEPRLKTYYENIISSLKQRNKIEFLKELRNGR
jgi:hypothetical protein